MSDEWDNLLNHNRHQLHIGGINIIIENGVFTPDPNLTYSTSIVIDNLPSLEGLRVADVGTGTGVLAILAALRGAKDVIATDIYDIAINNAQANVDLNNVAEKVSVLKINLLQGTEGKFDLIFANLPILEAVWNTSISDTFKAFLKEAQEKLLREGKVYIPWGSFAEQTRPLLEQIIKESGFESRLITVNKLGHDWYLYILSRSRLVGNGEMDPKI